MWDGYVWRRQTALRPLALLAFFVESHYSKEITPEIMLRAFEEFTQE